jgi:anhydro-N-acetylmuramic acid kinase
MLFGAYDGCLNLGGFSNISYDNEKGERIAYDLGPANMALNWIAGLKELEYDRNGEIAASGQISRELLFSMNRLDYYHQPAPKSLGREWFLSTFLPLLKGNRLAVEDLMATTAEHIAMQVAKGIRDAHLTSILVSGGGALNQHLMERLQLHGQAKFVFPDAQVVQYKEALIFALLGLLRMMKQINCLASVTGGKQDLSVGKIHKTNYHT